MSYMYTYTYDRIESVSVHRNRVILECVDSHARYQFEVEVDTQTLTQVIGLIFTFPVVITIDHNNNVFINGNRYGTFKKLSLKSK